MTRRALLSAIAAASFLTGIPVASLAAGARVALPPEQRAAVIAETKGPVVNYAGKVPGTNAYIGLVTRGEFVEVYICDSDKIAVWLKGTSKGGTVSASNATNDVVFKATMKGSNLAGNLTLLGKTISLTTVKVSYPDGVWKAYDTTATAIFKAGWVLLPDGTQRGAKTSLGIVSAVGALTSAGVDVGGNSTNDGAIPAGPVAMKKQVTKKDPPPAPNCANLEANYNRLMAIVNDDGTGGWSDANKTSAGNAAHDVYKQGMAMGCGFSPSPSGPGSAS